MKMHINATSLFLQSITPDLDVLLHELVAVGEVLEHAFHLIDELVSAFGLQLLNHHLLGVIAG